MEYPELERFENIEEFYYIISETKKILHNHRKDFIRNDIRYSIIDYSNFDKISILNDFWKIEELGYIFGKLDQNLDWCCLINKNLKNFTFWYEEDCIEYYNTDILIRRTDEFNKRKKSFLEELKDNEHNKVVLLEKAKQIILSRENL